MSIKHENGKVEGTITLRKLFKAVKKFFKDIFRRIIYFFNPKSERLSKKFKKRMKKEKKNREKYKDFNWFDRICLRLSGCWNLKAEPA